jgi:hypothetical protein
MVLFEGAVVAIIKEQGGDYGLQRLFGTFGAIIFGPIAGKLPKHLLGIPNLCSSFF